MLDKPKGIEQYEKRFGIIAIEKGFITPDELIKALTVQVQEDQKTCLENKLVKHVQVIAGNHYLLQLTLI